MNKIFTKTNIVLFIISYIFMNLSHFLGFKMEGYSLTILSPVVMILGYLPFALMEMNIKKSIENKVVKVLLTVHVSMTSIMITIYFFAMLIYNILG